MNKNIVIVLFLVVFFIGALYFFPSLEQDTPTTESDLETDIKMLKQDIQMLESLLFEREKFIFASELANDYLFYSEAEILDKKIEDTRYIIFFKAKYDNYEEYKHFLKVQTNETYNSHDFYIQTVEPENGITIDFVGYNNDYYLGGIITDTKIKEVQVLHNMIKHDAEVFKINDELYGWYSFFKIEHHNSDMEDRLKIRVLDEKGKEIWNKHTEEL